MSAQDEIQRVLETQASAWSSGDLAGYMASLAPDVRYVTAQGQVIGREVLQQRYGEAFGTPGAMGRLEVQIEQIDVLGQAAFVVIRWTLAGSLADRGGHALLGFVQRDGAWQLAYDATLTA